MMRDIRIEQSFTNRDRDSLNRYLVDLSRIDLINPEEEVQLAKKIKAGDQRALQKLVKANLRFVVTVAKKYQGQGLPLSDLINEGNMGLMTAAKKFDDTKGFKFISYAVWWIRQAIMMAMTEHSRMIRVPMNQVLAVQRIRNRQILLEQQLEREPTFEEIAEAAEMKPDAVLAHLSRYVTTRSLDEKLGIDSELELGGFLPDPNSEASDDEMIRQSVSRDIDHLLRLLPKREKTIIKELYGLDGNRLMSMDEVAERNKLSRERIRQIKTDSIAKLKKYAPERLCEHFQR